MIAGSAEGVDLEYSPPTKVAPPLGDVVHQLERTIVQLQNTVAHQSEEAHMQRNAITALTARIHALEESVKALEAAAK